MKGFLRIILVFALTSVVLWFVRLFVAAQYTVTPPFAGHTFLTGDRLLVVRTSYGVRLPLMSFFGYHRLGSGDISKGEIIAFNHPADTGRAIAARPVVVARCVALPGDTVRLSRNNIPVKNGDISDKERRFVVPTKGRRITVTRDNAPLLCNTINMHEPCHSAVMYGDTLFIDGHAARYVTFTRNYFWVYSENPTNANDSRSFGFVPETHIIGRVSRILYSIDPNMPFYRMFRRDRLFIKPL